MRGGGAAWLDELRTSVRCVLDRVAWEDIRHLRPRVRSLERDLAVCEAALRDARECEGAMLARATALETALRDRDAREIADSARIAALEAEVRARASTEKELRTRTASLETELTSAAARLDACQHRLAEIVASTSWRITAPIRWLKTLARQKSHTAR
jgi:chromosome segregation ATPase